MDLQDVVPNGVGVQKSLSRELLGAKQHDGPYRTSTWSLCRA
eukprot:COSAG01_NODE_71990_length_254_cov_0.670968_1_plen_41_part_01